MKTAVMSFAALASMALTAGGAMPKPDLGANVRVFSPDDDMKELRAIDLVESADMQIKTAQGSDLIDNTWSMTIPEKEWQKI